MWTLTDYCLSGGVNGRYNLVGCILPYCQLDQAAEGTFHCRFIMLSVGAYGLLLSGGVDRCCNLEGCFLPYCHFDLAAAGTSDCRFSVVSTDAYGPLL